MIEVYELLRTKENELARLRTEIEALRIVTPLLLELDDVADFQPGPDPTPPPAQKVPHKTHLSPDSDEVLFRSTPPKRSRLREWIVRSVGP
jgi:hypothetical protein